MIQVAQFPSRVILGLSRPFIAGTHPDTNAPEVIGPLWGEMSKLYFSMSLDRSSNPIGVGAMWPDLTKGPGHMVYFAGYEVASVPEYLGGLEALELEEANYAFVEHLGPMQDLPGVIANFYTNLLPNSGLQRRVGMDLELYAENEDPTQPTLVTIAAPVQ
jgi:predicted transcriptional regulator YdeE